MITSLLLSSNHLWRPRHVCPLVTLGPADGKCQLSMIQTWMQNNLYLFLVSFNIIRENTSTFVCMYFVVDERLCVTKQTLSCDNYDNDIWEHYNQYLTRLCSVQHPATGKGKHLMNEQTDIAIVVWLSFSIVPTSIFLICDIYDIDSQILSSVLFPILALLPETCPNLPPM